MNIETTDIDDVNKVGVLHYDDVYIYSVFEVHPVKPVINLKKERIDNIDNYQLGDIVSYINEDYYLIKISDEKYVTLFKKDVLTQNQINRYSDVFFTSYDNTLNLTNSWIEKFKDDLVSINGEVSGLLSLKDMIERFGYEYCSNHYSNQLCPTDLIPYCLYSDYWYWLLEDEEYGKISDDADKHLAVGKHIYAFDKESNLAIRSVLNTAC